MKNHIMLDLETLGTKPNAVIASIGAVGANGKSLFYEIIDVQTCIDVGLVADTDTLLWWLEQSYDAKMIFDTDTQKGMLKDVLVKFAAWIGDEPIVWGNGAAFDPVILRSAYGACDLEAPWDFRNERCFRTIKNLLPDIALEGQGTKHNALNDAQAQAAHLRKCLEKLGVEL